MKNCVYCNGSLGEVKYRDISDRLDFVAGFWNLIECTDCKSLVLSPYPSPSEAATYYPPHYIIPSESTVLGIRRAFSLIEQRFLRMGYRHEVATLYQRLPIFKDSPLKILEIGCGNGNRLKFFHDLNIDIVGVDFSEADVAGLRSKGMNAHCIEINALANHFEPASFDLIMSFDVLEHLPDLQESLEKICTLLKPGGWMVAGLPSQDCYGIRVFGKRWTALAEVPRHVTVPSLTGAQKLFESFGLTKLDTYPYGALNCAIVLGLSIFDTASASKFYGGSLKIATLMKRLFGGAVTFLSAPLFYLENHFTDHPSRFVIYGQKQ